MHEFNELAKPIEARVGVDSPWLKRIIENGEEVVRMFEYAPDGKSGYWRVPSEQQLEVGILAETRDEYLRLKSGN
jgi:hypothetical protein